MTSSFLAISNYPKKRIFTNINYRWCIVKEIVFVQNKKRLLMKFEFLKKDLVLTISLILAIVSCLIHSPKIEYINFEVLISLFNLMVAIKALEQLKILDKLAVAILNKCNNSRSISIILILLCFICSMFVTNDVALLTFVPITLVISKKNTNEHDGYNHPANNCGKHRQ